MMSYYLWLIELGMLKVRSGPVPVRSLKSPRAGRTGLEVQDLVRELGLRTRFMNPVLSHYIEQNLVRSDW